MYTIYTPYLHTIYTLSTLSPGAGVCSGGSVWLDRLAGSGAGDGNHGDRVECRDSVHTAAY